MMFRVHAQLQFGGTQIPLLSHAPLLRDTPTTMSNSTRYRGETFRCTPEFEATASQFARKCLTVPETPLVHNVERGRPAALFATSTPWRYDIISCESDRLVLQPRKTLGRNMPSLIEFPW